MASEAAEGDSGKPAVVVAIDESEHSYYALEWALDHFFSGSAGQSPLFSLVIVHAKPSPASVIGLAGPGSFFSWFSPVPLDTLPLNFCDHFTWISFLFSLSCGC